jgi:hypothetical protein
VICNAFLYLSAFEGPEYLVHPKQVALPFCSLSLLPAARPERNYPSDWPRGPVTEKEALDLIQLRDNVS